MGRNRSRLHRMPVDVVLGIAHQICKMAGVDPKFCWVHGSQSPASRNLPKKDSDLDLHLVVKEPKTVGPWDGIVRPGRGNIPRMISFCIENRRVEVSLTDQEHFPFSNSPRVVNLNQLASLGDQK